MALIQSKSNSISSSCIRQLEDFGKRIASFGVNFVFCLADGSISIRCLGGDFISSDQQMLRSAKAAQTQWQGSGTIVGRCGDNMVSTVVTEDSDFVGAAVIDAGLEGSDKIEYFRQMSEMFVERMQIQQKSEQQIGSVSNELAHTYEELVLLHKLSTNMHVTEQGANYLQMACDSLTEIVNVEGIAVLLEQQIDNRNQLMITAGSGLIDIDERMAAVLEERILQQMRAGREALVDSEIDSPFQWDWPENIRNIIVVPLCGKSKENQGSLVSDDNLIGLMVAVNRQDKQDFDSTDIKLFNSVASGCAVFVENGGLFLELKELFMGSLKALTNSIDAKDQYTRGHSERVAFISRWIAERLSENYPINEDEIQYVYLAGLLHDVGKMGISEAVLKKNGRLSESEINHIQTHPTIGAGILREIKQMRNIVPGVLSHHERFDGKGYPEGLEAEQIPLTGRIIGLADTFDAMTSKRVYRDAMSVEQALAEIENGLGTQFDSKIGQVFLSSDIDRLWNIMQDGFGSHGNKENFAQYGLAAIGTLLR